MLPIILLLPFLALPAFAQRPTVNDPNYTSPPPPTEVTDPVPRPEFVNLPAPVPSVPGPVPLLGAAAAWGASRQLRRRVRGGGRG